jgi:hypothetical protein
MLAEGTGLPVGEGVEVCLGTWTYGPLVKREPTPDQLQRFAAVLAASPQIEVPVEHLFTPGMYVRKCTIQADAYVLGKKHRHQHPTLLVRGECTINTDEGMVRITAPHMWISQEGAQRALYTHTQCEFVTVHLNPDDTRDLEAIEAEVIVPQTLAELTGPYQIAQDAPLLTEFADDLQGVYA